MLPACTSSPKKKKANDERDSHLPGGSHLCGGLPLGNARVQRARAIHGRPGACSFLSRARRRAQRLPGSSFPRRGPRDSLARSLHGGRAFLGRCSARPPGATMPLRRPRPQRWGRARPDPPNHQARACRPDRVGRVVADRHHARAVQGRRSGERLRQPCPIVSAIVSAIWPQLTHTTSGHMPPPASPNRHGQVGRGGDPSTGIGVFGPNSRNPRKENPEKRGRHPTL